MPKSRHREGKLAEYEHFKRTSPDDSVGLVVLVSFVQQDRQSARMRRESVRTGKEMTRASAAAPSNIIGTLGEYT